MSSAQFEHFVTTGFKLYSGYYAGGISKKDLEELGGRDDIDWGAVELEARVREVTDIASRLGMIKFWKSWKVSLSDLASDAVGMNYLLVLLRDWERKGRPTAGKKRDAFETNVTVLFDRMVYEYVVGRWKGSSDSRVARNLKALGEGNPDAVFDPVADEDWDRLLSDMVDHGTIEGEAYTQGKSVSNAAKIVLYYYYCLIGVEGPNTDLDVDHIIPRRKFGSLTPEKSASLMPMLNNIGNLALLPKTDNIDKRDRTLCEIDSSFSDAADRKWLVSQITKYEEIAEKDFPKYCNAEDVKDLVKVRGDRLKAVFADDRPKMIGVR